MKLRRAVPEDHPRLARVLAESFHGLYAVALGKDTAVRARRMEQLLPFGVLGPGDVYVAPADGKVVFSLTLRTREGAPHAGAFRDALRSLRESDGWGRAFWATSILWLVAGRRPGPTEAHWENLVTFPEVRRRGIAFDIAPSVYEMLRGMGKTSLSGQVMSSNTADLGLNEKAGWRVVGRNYWLAPILWPLFGTAGVVRVRKDLAPAAERAPGS